MKWLVLQCLFLALGAGFLSGCEDTTETSISSAQACLDQATPANVSQCTQMLNGVTTTDAYVIRCSAHYIAQGFTTARFVSAYNDLKSTPTGSNAIAQSMSFMAFNDTDTTNGLGTDDSQTTVNDCSSSGSTSLYRLSVLTRMATIVANVARAASAVYNPSTGFNPTAIQAAIQSFNGNSAALGTTAVAADSAYCAAGSSYAGTSVCTTLNAAVAGGGSTASIGAALISQLGTSH